MNNNTDIGHVMNVGGPNRNGRSYTKEILDDTARNYQGSPIKYTGFYRDFLDGRAALSTTDSVFSNNKCLFCEFNDIIVPTWLSIIYHILKTKSREMLKYVDISTFNGMEPDDLLRWYIIRKHRNALLDIKKEGIDDNIINIVTYNLLEDSNIYYNIEGKPFLMDYAYTLTKVVRVAGNIINNFVIYVEQGNDAVDKFLTSLYGNKVEFRSGDLVGALSDIDNDSTFVFSDVTKILALQRAGKLKGSSVILADGYGYNYKLGGRPGYDEDLIVDIDRLMKEDLFKFNTFNNFTE